jgi:hypothetical protein
MEYANIPGTVGRGSRSIADLERLAAEKSPDFSAVVETTSEF